MLKLFSLAFIIALIIISRVQPTWSKGMPQNRGASCMIHLTVPFDISPPEPKAADMARLR